MKRFMQTLVLIASGVLVAVPGPTLAKPGAELAPADRYFGQMQMSILGVRNALHDLTLRITARPEEALQVYGKTVLVEDALRDWSQKFPSDPWIPKYLYTLAELYRTIDTNDARIRKNDTLDWLITSYPASDYAKMGRV